MADDRPVPLDEYPVHQVPPSVKHVATGDRNACDRCIFHVFDHSGRHRFFHDLAVASGQRGLPDFLRRDRVEARYARLTGHSPRDMDFHTLHAALRHAIVMLRIAYRRAHFGAVAVPADPVTLILHHGSLRAMVQGTYWMR